MMDQKGIFYSFPPSSSLPCVTLANGSISKGIGVAQPIAWVNTASSELAFKVLLSYEDYS